MGPEILLMVILAGTIGAAIGTFTGLVPGIHVNTAATMLLGAYPLINEAVSAYTDPTSTPILVACCIVAASTAHSFVDFVPSVFMGIPDTDEVLTVLPGHRLLLEGRGMMAVRAAAIGSLVGSITALALAIPLQWIMVSGGTGIIDGFTLSMIVVTLGIITLTSGNPALSVALVIISGILGLLVNSGMVPIFGMIEGGTMLFPLLTGLFGLAPLMGRSSHKRMPRQRDTYEDPVGPVPGLKGVITGMAAGWFPGITSATGAALASTFSKDNDPARFISMTASIGTVTSVFSFVTLSVTGKGRSGTSLAVGDVLGDSIRGFCSEPFLMIMASIAVASALGYVAAICTGRAMARLSEHMPADLINTVVLVLTIALVLLFTGPFGLVVLLLAGALGMVPPAMGVSRICLTGCLVIPVLLNQLERFL